MLISGRALITFSLFVIFYTALKGGYYFLSNRLQEVGFLFLFGLFAYSALVAALNVKEKDLRWSWWVFATFAFVGYTFVLPGYQFAQHTGVSMVPSIFASREFLIVLLAPTLYFLYRIGYRVEDIERVFLMTLGALIFSYIFHYFRIDLEAAYFSPNPTIAGMVTHDEWRGYRLKPPSTALILASVISPVLLVREKKLLSKLLWGFIFLLCLWAWSLLMARSAIAMMIMGVVLYHVWFAYKLRLSLMFLSLPIIIPVMSYGVAAYFETMRTTDGGVRYRSYTIAFENIEKYPFFGFGQQSAATLTEQQIFWYKFYSADIGIIGVAFKYGLVGAALYMGMLFYIIARGVSTNWLYRREMGVCNLIFFGIVAKAIGDVFKFVLSVDYVYIQGLTIGSVVIALSAIYRHKFSRSGV